MWSSKNWDKLIGEIDELMFQWKSETRHASNIDKISLCNFRSSLMNREVERTKEKLNRLEERDWTTLKIEIVNNFSLFLSLSLSLHPLHLFLHPSIGFPRKRGMLSYKKSESFSDIIAKSVSTSIYKTTLSITTISICQHNAECHYTECSFTERHFS